ncbi:class I adenylate-forming enzyme family protein [Prauserella cavernicola]|uniref:Acyl--CoA ligase n=1 Tax=Prauserella cavernicola TaxID=2800127 RepID=A0A934QWW7_9PSEU|nr:class I adenylate-forming enzyme family protein [Prauserella cavernicola]MBK1787865.1 acyl--CoA ligase [Prauserella cavernicola]
MSYVELTPTELLSLGFDHPRVAEESWCVRWDRCDADIEQLVLDTLPPTIDFHTSGSTGPSQCWRRLRENVWSEAGLLADLIAPERPEALASFVPPVHLYGALASVLVPARLRIPAWYRPSFFGRMPPREHDRWAVIATPWIFTLLLEQLSWVRSMDHVTVMHGGAMLPASAGDFLREAGPDRALIVEVLGSTEAGGIGTRRWREGEPPPWRLFGDVTAVQSGGDVVTDDEAPLRVRSPRLAFRPDGEPPETWEMDDQVEMLDDRTFRFSGRRSRLVKVNGRRINLDEMENALRTLVSCTDLAILPVADAMIGEHVELLIVPESGESLSDIDMAAVINRLGVRPRRVHAVDRIDRSATGKLLKQQQSLLAKSEVE